MVRGYCEGRELTGLFLDVEDVEMTVAGAGAGASTQSVKPGVGGGEEEGQAEGTSSTVSEAGEMKGYWRM